jgi:ubiquinol-cytochrome c reductase iron-sulfur subunit
LLPPHAASAWAETAVLAFLFLTTLAAAGFIALYFVEPDTQLLGLALGLAFAFLAGAAMAASKRLVPQETAEELRDELIHAEQQREVAELVEEAGEGISRRRLILTAAGSAVVVLGAALVVPAASLGPFLGTDRFYRTPWGPGRRLVDERGRAIAADDVSPGAFLTAFPEGAALEELGSSLIVIRLEPEELQLPAERAGWAPEGILAFSKICPHAGCAVSMYRHPLFEPHTPGPALVCPCHYSTFDPTTGGTVEFGPAGRDLPQLPLRIDGEGNLRAGGRFSAPIGPSWWGVRLRDQ